ncbi:MAG: class I SAM-dependent methyltransferase [Syntrophaceae bacterium]|nr:class I SAM-dependent methyltransferase [Syntrophaceae bacterium]
MKLNWAERLAVNNPVRPLQQRLEIKWFQKRVNVPPGAQVLEIGCGRGAGSRLIKQVFRPNHIHAMDLDFNMIRKADRYLKPNERESISFFVGDVCTLPFSDRTMDAVFGFGVLHHVPDWQGALREITRVLKVEGLYFMEELYPTLYQNFITRRILLHPTDNRFQSTDLKQEISAAGLVLEDYIENKHLEILGIAKKVPVPNQRSNEEITGSAAPGGNNWPG